MHEHPIEQIGFFKQTPPQRSEMVGLKDRIKAVFLNHTWSFNLKVSNNSYNSYQKNPNPKYRQQI
jgi:hypothetical protein